MIAIIDYGMGNLRSVQKGLESIGLNASIATDPDQVVAAEGVILPGVGAFADAIKNLKDTGMDKAIFEIVRLNKPFLGLCLGMQLMFSESEEDGIYQGLDIIKGRVIKLPPGEKVPHMGWNQINPVGGSPLFKGIPDGSYFYFVHSYYCAPEEDATIATSQYGIEFTCAVQKGNIMATQFHPEKSSSLGLKVLGNFGDLVNSGV